MLLIDREFFLPEQVGSCLWQHPSKSDEFRRLLRIRTGQIQGEFCQSECHRPKNQCDERKG